MMLEALAGRTEIDDRKQHEDEGLDEADEQDVERLPDREGQSADHRSAHRAYERKRECPQSGDQGDHDAAREDVAEETQRESDGLDELLDDVEGDENDARRERKLEGFGEAAEIAGPSLHADAVPLDDEDDDQAHGERLVEVGVGAVQDRKEAERKNLDPVRDQDVEKEREGQRDDEERVLRDVLLDQPPELVIAPFEYGLHLGRFSRPQLGTNPECDPDRDHHCDGARDQAVVVEGAQRAAAQADGGVRDVDVLDHARNPCLTPAPTMTSCAPPTPRSTAHAGLPRRTAVRTATALRTAMRTTLPMTKGVSLASRAANRWPLREPMMRPAPSPTPSVRCPAMPVMRRPRPVMADETATVSLKRPPTFTA